VQSGGHFNAEFAEEKNAEDGERLLFLTARPERILRFVLCECLAEVASDFVCVICREFVRQCLTYGMAGRICHEAADVSRVRRMAGYDSG
jgi:hypothetical protein